MAQRCLLYILLHNLHLVPIRNQDKESEAAWRGLAPPALHKPTSYYDLFRFENGKVVEHWDIIETIPPRSEWKNDNRKFQAECTAKTFIKGEYP